MEKDCVWNEILSPANATGLNDSQVRLCSCGVKPTFKDARNVLRLFLGLRWESVPKEPLVESLTMQLGAHSWLQEIFRTALANSGVVDHCFTAQQHLQNDEKRTLNASSPQHHSSQVSNLPSKLARFISESSSVDWCQRKNFLGTTKVPFVRAPPFKLMVLQPQPVAPGTFH